MRPADRTVLKLAHVLIEFYGSKAELEAERRARAAAKNGDETQYMMWSLVAETLPVVAASAPERRTVH
jgi:hypothetical protein